MDENGNPVLKDIRSDFNSAVRFLRNSVIFIEGTSLDNVDAHFVLEKATKPRKSLKGGAVMSKQCLWVRKDKLKQWIQITDSRGLTKKNVYNGLVYFIHMENNMRVFQNKYTTNLKKRLDALQTAHPYLLQVYAIFENVSRQKETELHQLFRKKHVRSEWFSVTPDIIDSVCKVKSA